MNKIISIIASTFRMSIPLILASLGGIYSAKAGIVAMGLEGMMLSGAFFAAYTTYITNNPYVGLFGGVLAGIILSLIHGLLVVRYKIDQVIGGIGINLFSQGLTTLLLQIVWGNRGKSTILPTIKNIKLPLIGKISPLFFLSIILIILSKFIFDKTKYGLHLKMTGENPRAAISLGVNVDRIKYKSLAITGALAGMAGSYLSIDQLNLFARDMTAGRGFIALSIDILGRYSPTGILSGSFLFGLADALQISLQSASIPGQLLQIIPYLVTLLVLIFGVKYVRAPESMGKNIEY